MGRIYSEAKMVIAWLGSGPPALVEALEVLQQGFSLGHIYSEMFFEINYDRFNMLQANEYWTRVWIIQEYTLAKDVELWCGTSKMSSVALFNTIMWYRFFGSPVDHPRQLNRNLHKIIELRGNLDDGKRPLLDLPTLCEMFPVTACADVRDWVYALLSLVAPQYQSDFPIHADYSKSPSELFMILFHRACIDEGGPMDSHPGSEAWDPLSRTMLELVEMLEIDDSDENFRVAEGIMLARYEHTSGFRIA